MSPEVLVILAVCLPAVAVALIWLTGSQPNLREAVTLVTAIVVFGIVLSIVPDVLAGARPEVSIIEVMSGVSLAFSVEPLGMLFGIIASGLWIVNSIYSIGYMRGNDEPRQTPFYMCFAAAISSTLGIAFAANLFTLFIFYEILTLTTYPLVTHKGNEEARNGGRTYLLMLLGTSMVLLLPAIIWTWVATGNMSFEPGGILGAEPDPTIVSILLLLFVYGFGKAAVMPFHFWLPAAMVAPTPVSALLHAVAVVKAGVFSIVKVVVYVFGIETLASAGTTDWLLWVAGATVIAASVVALMQDNLKKRLAYSTVSQLSYVVLAVAILTPISVVGAALHIAAHAVSKITLFFAAGSIYTAAHLTEVSQLRGIGRSMPWTMTAFAVGALSMIGVPPTAGFLGKWFMLSGAMETGQWIAVAVIFASTLLNAAYFLPIVYSAFFRKADESAAASHHGEAPLPIVIALTMTAAGTVALFLFPGVALALSRLLVGG